MTPCLLERHCFNRQTTQWIRNWLNGLTLKAVVNALMSKWQAAMSGAPQGSVLGLILFNVFVGDMDVGIECTLSSFANDTKLCDVVDTLEGRDAIQRDLDRLEKRVCANLMKFNQAKCKVLNMGTWVMGHGNPRHKYRLGGEYPESIAEKNNLMVLVDEKLNMSCQPVLTDQKANRILGCIKRSMASTLREMILPLYSILVRTSWSTASSSRAPNIRRMWTCWSESAGGPQR
ncbi:rna-directed dna polymerase from mobile element jockey-like [Limosa lapponica baueri]|uniref:Rna-directed dna polymerase from mobile element jockey-like n=1 Tax=Limosa lapponica baueri TaxID=1758121 RepID=A0A2I0UC55_LIMLA|nr:rna-directed dna polymerase from mobile element jockey-like [Limosa lapponica baueri]